MDGYTLYTSKGQVYLMAIVIDVEMVSLKEPTQVFGEPYASKVIAHKDEVKLK